MYIFLKRRFFLKGKADIVSKNPPPKTSRDCFELSRFRLFQFLNSIAKDSRMKNFREQSIYFLRCRARADQVSSSKTRDLKSISWILGLKFSSAGKFFLRVKRVERQWKLLENRPPKAQFLSPCITIGGFCVSFFGVRVSDKWIPPLPPTIESTSWFVSPFITDF